MHMCVCECKPHNHKHASLRVRVRACVHARVRVCVCACTFVLSATCLCVRVYSRVYMTNIIAIKQVLLEELVGDVAEKKEVEAIARSMKVSVCFKVYW